jgi:WD40 repeat protein
VKLQHLFQAGEAEAFPAKWQWRTTLGIRLERSWCWQQAASKCCQSRFSSKMTWLKDNLVQHAFMLTRMPCCSAGKDRAVKYWDMDRFELLLELPAHHGEVWALALSAYGDFLLSGKVIQTTCTLLPSLHS